MHQFSQKKQPQRGSPPLSSGRRGSDNYSSMFHHPWETAPALTVSELSLRRPLSRHCRRRRKLHGGMHKQSSSRHAYSGPGWQGFRSVVPCPPPQGCPPCPNKGAREQGATSAKRRSRSSGGRGRTQGGPLRRPGSTAGPGHSQRVVPPTAPSSTPRQRQELGATGAPAMWRNSIPFNPDATLLDVPPIPPPVIKNDSRPP